MVYFYKIQEGVFMVDNEPMGMPAGKCGLTIDEDTGFIKAWNLNQFYEVIPKTHYSEIYKVDNSPYGSLDEIRPLLYEFISGC